MYNATFTPLTGTRLILTGSSHEHLCLYTTPTQHRRPRLPYLCDALYRMSVVAKDTPSGSLVYRTSWFLAKF